MWQVSPSLFPPIFQGGKDPPELRRRRRPASTRPPPSTRRRPSTPTARSPTRWSTVQKLGRGSAWSSRTGVDALRDASKLSPRSRYDTGLSNYLEILIADQQLFDQELLLAQTRGEEMRAFVELYRALGGGWQPEPGAPGTTASEPAK